MPSHPIDVHVGRRVRLRRTILGLSQENLGKAIGVTFQQVQKYERGLNRIGSSRLFELAKVLGVSVSYFYEGLDQGGDEKAEGSMALALGAAEDEMQGFEYEQLASRETLELARAFNRVRDIAVRKRILELVKSLAEDPLESNGDNKDAA